MKWIAALLCLLLSFSVHAGEDEESDALRAAKDAGKLTEVQFAEQAMQILKKYHPNDYEIHTLSEYRLLLATQLEDKQITPAEFRYKWAERHNAFKAKREAAQVQYQERQQQAASNAQQEDAARQRAAIGAGLQSIGNSINRAYQPRGTNCVTTPIGSSLSTRCY